jgi:hypothetical protein
MAGWRPKIRDLVRLAEATKLKLTKQQKTFLFTVNSFNIEARYPEEKLKFYKICTKKFAEKNLNKIKETYLWLKSQLPKAPIGISKQSKRKRKRRM